MKAKILVIVGPTASGKSDLAVRLAKKFNGEVISADSRQVYKGLNVGTGKITKQEMQGVPHHLLDVASPKRIFSAAQYKKLAEQKIAEVLKRGKLPIVVGGTGFYIDALRMDLPQVPPNTALRQKLGKKSVEDLQKMLGKHKIADPNNKVRLVRAIEIIKALGGLPEIKKRSDYNFVFIGLKPKDLDKKIHKRLLSRIPGIIRETKKLSLKRAYELGLEYRFASLYLEGKMKRKEFIDKLETATRQYSKRQMTWFRRNKDIKWLTSGDSSSVLSTTRRLLGSPNRER